MTTVSGPWQFRRRRIWRATVILVLATGPSTASPAASLVEGATASRNYFAPADFEVVDAVATAAEAAAAGNNVPLVVRVDGNALAQVLNEFDAAFRKTRAAYLEALVGAFGTRTIGTDELKSPRFVSFRSEFQSANPLFPVDASLAQTWAEGQDGEPTRHRLAEALRSVLEHRWIGDIRPASTVHIVTLTPADRIRAWGEATRHARVVDHSAIVSLERAGQELRHSLDRLDRGAAGFMASLLRPTVVEDPYLTGLLLHERLGDLAQRRTLRRGDLIARQGATIDTTTALVLTHLARSGLEAAEFPPASPAPRVPAATLTNTSPHPTPAGRWQALAWIAGGSILALVASAFVVTWWMRRRHPIATLQPWVAPPDGTAPRSWRDVLVPHLARELKNRLVQALFAQRQALLHNEAAASERVADLEARLARLQPAIAEKIRSYERRIQALEAELEEKDQETRDLIRAKLVLARQELDEEITRNRVGWN